MVLGHESCGAIKAAIGKYKLGNITALLKTIDPAIAMSKNFQGEQTEKNGAYVQEVTKKNIVHTINEIRQRSPILNQMEKADQIKIIGGYYHIETGEVTFTEQHN